MTPYSLRVDYQVLPKTDIRVSRPALELAGYLCECCKGDNGLRVCKRSEDLVVLCSGCRITDGFRQVMRKRREVKR
jgi:hypothetical protein